MDRTPHTAPRGARGALPVALTLVVIAVGATMLVACGYLLGRPGPEPAHAPVTLSPSVDSWQEAAVECANHPDGEKRLVVEFGPTHDEDEFTCTEQ